MTTGKDRTGLSPSSFNEYLSCPKKYYYRKVAKIAPDRDYDDDQTTFNVGKAFHKLCEDSLHDIDTVKDSQIRGILELYNLDPDDYWLMIKAMLRSYHATHVKGGMRVIACEVEIETPYFFGVVDVVLQDASGDWWIGDLKTAASFVEAQIPNLFSHPQLNLYAAHSPIMAQKLGLDIKNFKGCRYRVTTKSKIKRKSTESDEDYLFRLMATIRSVDVLLPIERMIHRNVYQMHKHVRSEISKGEAAVYPRNYGSCFQYYKPCQFWSQCNNGRMYSEIKDVTVITSE